MSTTNWTLLPAEALLRTCPTDDFTFETTADLADLDELLGQDRAVAALKFSVGMHRDGYNLFALGGTGVGRHEVIRQYLTGRAEHEPTPRDWCYVNNFENAEQPLALGLPSGRGAPLRDAIRSALEELKLAIPAALETEEYLHRKQALIEEIKARQAQAFKVIQAAAQAKHLTLMRTPVGLVVLPERGGEVLSPEAFAELDEKDRKQVQRDIESLEGDIQDHMRHNPQWDKERHDRLQHLNREVTAATVEGVVRTLREANGDLPEVLAFIDAFAADIVNNIDQFLDGTHKLRSEDPTLAYPPAALRAVLKETEGWRKYEVNLMVDASAQHGAPVIYEDNPTLPNLVGRVDHRSMFGMMTTDFGLIRPGALHRANGGYLMLDALRLLRSPFAWEELKRALRSKLIRIESPAQLLSLVSTVSLEPKPIPLDIRVVLVGERWLYHLLAELDPDFSQLFKVPADFATRIERDTGDGVGRYARMIATRAREEELRPLSRQAVARIIEHAGRIAGDAERLSIHMESLVDLLRESDYWAGEEGQPVVGTEHVQKAIDARIYRESRLRDQLKEETLRGTVRIATQGRVVGQVNGLSVWQVGGTTFGHPARITAQIHMGRGEVVDIEREVKLSGPIHSKGVLILSGFLGARYAQRFPLTLSASLVFEQSYGGVEGDSASMAELCALLSSIADVPLRQDLAMTGSVDQHGNAQAVGGVNEKVEGFFDLCQARGLTGSQGVVLPAANRKHLMLRQDVVAAARAATFAVYTVESVDDAIELFTGLPAGTPGPDGTYPEGSFNRRVLDRLEAMAAAAKQFSRETREGDAEDEAEGQREPSPPIP